MILAILQARYSSTRLPGKVLMPIFGKPMLLRQVERVQRSQLIDKLIIATSADASDDSLAKLCSGNGIACFRGSLNDVLDRFYRAASQYKPEHVVRLTGDCPLADSDLIDRVISNHLSGSFDYTSNVATPTYPDGLDVEVFKYQVLAEAWQKATLPSQREHVTPYISRQPDLFAIGSVNNAVDLSGLRWTVDEQEDFELIKNIYENLYPRNPAFTTADVLAFLEQNTKLGSMNKHYRRNEGLEKSLRQDKEYIENAKKKG